MKAIHCCADRYKVLLLLLLITCTALFADEYDEYNDDVPPVKLTEATDLSAEGKIAKSEQRVILLLISQEHCPFCVQIKEDILGPMIKGEDHKERLLIRELFIDMGSQIIDFQGKKRSSSEFALMDYGVDLTPTMLFLSPEGKELTKRMIGIYTPDMFFYYVDESIRSAIDALDESANM